MKKNKNKRSEGKDLELEIIKNTRLTRPKITSIDSLKYQPFISIVGAIGCFYMFECV